MRYKFESIINLSFERVCADGEQNFPEKSLEHSATAARTKPKTDLIE